MASQPSEEDIDNFLSFVGVPVPRTEVIDRLKSNNSNLESAVNEYFDNPGSEKYNRRWNEDLFNNDPQGGAARHNISFDIQGPDVPGPSSYNHFDGNGLAARPPSRTSHNKSPLGRVIDMSAEAAAADPSTSMSFADHRDNGLQQALAASAAEYQESGVTNTNEVHFGPATRSQYVTANWALVPMGKSSVREVLNDPEPAERKRGLNVPAFLKPSTENNRLGALLTIYSQIPLIREVFLPRAGQDMAPNYGYDKEWWAGKAIDIPAVFGEDVTPPSEVTLELQRLMAFLDKTERSYGSAEALANLSDVQRELASCQAPDSQLLEAAVLKAWKKSMSENHPTKVSKVFSKGAPSEQENVEFSILELTLPDKDDIQNTLYDLADEALWPNLQPLTLDSSPYLSHVADVVAFQLEGGETKKNVEIPAIWYPDRYLQSSKQAALDMRLRKIEVQNEIEQIDKARGYLSSYNLPNGKSTSVKELFEVALLHDQAKVPEDGEVRKEQVEALNEELAATHVTPKTAHLSAQLRKLVENIDKKLESLNEEKEKSIEALRKLSTMYTDPASEVDPDAPKFHRYSLRGVSTTKNTLYLCKRAEPDLIDMDLDGDGPKSNRNQWWRIHFAASGPHPVTVEKTTEEKVLEAAKTESKNILLVYASDKAMNFEVKPLPTSLQTFVQEDNDQFKIEQRETEDSNTQLSSPGKRKFDERSDGSAETAPERWNGAGSPTGNEMGLDGEMNNRAQSARQGDLISQDGPSNHEVIVGVDPKDIMNNGQSSGQEMQERSSMRMMVGALQKGDKASTIDSMDLDEVVEDEHAAGESAAVRQFGIS